MKKIYLIISISLLVPLQIYALVISEIMYDPEGTDSKREWIEIHNDAVTDFALTLWKLFESDVAHKITLFSGENILKANEYAVIASDAATFLIDFPNYSKNLFDSVFSLNNSGEVLSLVDPNGNQSEDVLYTPDMGAKGTGNSLQLKDQIFIPADPTPGEVNKDNPENENEEDNNSTSTSSPNEISSHSSQIELIEEEYVSKIKISAGRERIVSIYKELRFDGAIEENSNRGVKYNWNFGDGYIDKGREVEHFYKKPGIYNVILNAYSKNDLATSRTKILVIEPKLKLKIEDDGIWIENLSEFVVQNELDCFKLLKRGERTRITR
jgi:hypothetical protein